MALPNTSDRPQEDGGIYMVGFSANAVEGARFMSGMVDIIDVQVDTARNAVLFIVRNLDTTGSLFKTGLLTARKLDAWNPPKKQGLMVEGRSYA